MTKEKAKKYVLRSFRDRDLRMIMPTLESAKAAARHVSSRWKKEVAKYEGDKEFRTTYYSDGDYYIEVQS